MINKIVEKYKYLLDKAPCGMGIFEFSEPNGVIYLNDKYFEISGYTRDEYAGFAEEAIYNLLSLRDYDTLWSDLRNPTEGKTYFETEYRIATKIGKIVWIKLIVDIIEIEEEKFIIATFIDISNRKDMPVEVVNKENNKGCSVSIVEIGNGKTKLIYANDTFFNIIGYSKTEYMANTDKINKQLVSSQTRIKIKKEIGLAVANNKIRHFEYRLKRKDGGIAWIERNFFVIKEGDDRSTLISLSYDITDKHNLKRNMQYEQDRYLIVAEQTKTAVFEWDFITGEYYQSGLMAKYDMSKETSGDLLSNSGNINNIHPDDIAQFETLVDAMKSKAERCETILRLKMTDGSFRWSKMVALFYRDEEGIIERATGIIIDIDEERRNAEFFETLVESLPSGIGMYKFDNKMTPLFFSDKVAEHCNMTREEYIEAVKDNAANVIEDEDVPKIFEELRAANRENRGVCVTYRLKEKNGVQKWTHLSGSWMEKVDDVPILCATFTDITDIMNMELKLREEKLKYQIAAEVSGFNTWEYDILNDKLSILTNQGKLTLEDNVIYDYTKNLHENSKLTEKSYVIYCQMIEKLKAGQEQLKEDLWFNDDGVKYCERIAYKLLKDNNGRPLKAFGSSQNVTKEKETEILYSNEMKRKASLEKTLVSSSFINVTRNKVIDYYNNDIKESIAVGCTFHDWAYAMADYLVEPDERPKFVQNLSADNILKKYNQGEKKLHYESKRLVNKVPMWISTTINLMEEPENDDVVAFVYDTDITESKLKSSIIDRITDVYFDFMGYISLDSEQVHLYSYETNEDPFQLPSNIQKYTQLKDAFVDEFIVIEEREVAREILDFNNIIKELEQLTVFNTSFAVKNPVSHKIERKKWNFTYLGNDKSKILYSRSDITEIYNRAIKQQNQLNRAMYEARRASASRSEFLSKLNHDIRTPLNAIIGLAGLAETSDSSVETMEYLKHIGASGKYLMSIINDVLDMAKIEDSKIELHPTTVYLPDFFRNTIDLILPMAAEKGISITIDHSGRQKLYLKMDTSYIRQAVVNLLINAINFTPAGGHVSVSLNNEPWEGNRIKNSLIIRDDGIGISEEFLSRIFDPFAQENQYDDSKASGTGLGLTIVKNIVNLMDGEITVISRKGAGTQVAVDWYFDLVDSDEFDVQIMDTTTEELNFSGCRILVIEDNPLNMEIISKLLKKKGASVDIAQNGQLGVNLFKTSEEFQYNAILMDIRMPVMDGLSATKSIRSLGRKDSSTVPIIAMTANAFREDERASFEAGMNAHLAKPIEPLTLYKVLAKEMKK